MRRRYHISVGLLTLILPGCIARGEQEPGRVPEASAGSAPLSDSLVLTAPEGATVWFTEGRLAVAASGAGCTERGLEIRRDGSRLRVPLLYTVSIPVLIDDTTMRAELAEHCKSARAYRVNLKTARPTPMDAGGKP